MGRLWAWALAGALGMTACWETLPAETTEKPESKKGRKPKAGANADERASMVDATLQRPTPEGKPNVLLIVWDTVRADHLSLYNYGRQTTPKLDAWAKDAVVYERAVSPGMWTLPSHASLFTGLPESGHGADASNHHLENRFVTLAESLYGAGWSTWLFAANPHLKDHTNLGQGFERREFPEDERWRKKATKATMSKVIDNDASNTLGPAWKPGKYPSGRGADRTKDAGPVATDALLAWLDERPEKERPFFATINLMEAHVPRVPSLESRKALFTDEQIQAQLAFDQSYGYLLAYTVGLHEFTPEQLGLITDVYDASLRDLDRATGELLDKLKERGVLDDTIVILTADHGEHLGEHHLADHKFSVYNGLVRVPLVIRYPKAMPPGRVSDVVSNLGVYATVAELTGAPLPPGTLSTSLRSPGPREAYSELVEPTRLVFDRMTKVHKDFDTAPYEKQYVSVEGPQYKCIDRSDGVRELYDVVADPGETKDLAAILPKEAAELCSRTAAWRQTFPRYDKSKRPAGEGPAELDAATKERLIQLGYMSPEGGK